MEKTKFLLTLTTLVLVFVACVENDPGVVTSEDKKPEPTPVGIPIGVSNSKTIGANGGTLSSLDGKITLDIPVGALSSDNEIRIQPITSFVPNGNGNAYQLGPEGTKFNKPIRITFIHGLETSATNPPITGIAFQGTDGIWYSSGDFTWNETNRTVSTETTHFSSWGAFDDLRIVPKDNKVIKFNKDGRPSYQLRVNESAEFMLIVLGSLDPKPGEEVSALIPVEYREDTGILVKEWSVNGDINGKDKNGNPSIYGKISVSGENKVCMYTAPEKKPGSSKNPVQLSVYLTNLKYKYVHPNGMVEAIGNLWVSTSIDIIGDYHFDVQIKYNNPHESEGLGTFVAEDLIRLKIEVKEGKVSASEITNVPGLITPASETKYSCTTSWVLPLDGFDCITATGAIGSVDIINTGNTSTQYINLSMTGKRQRAKWKFQCAEAEAIYFGGEQYPDAPMLTASFILKDTVQTFLDQSNLWFVILTPE